MKYLLAATLALCSAAHASLPNEAVRTLPGGMRVVEAPPGPRNDFGRPTPMPPDAWAGGMMPGYVIDTSEGLRECLQPWLERNCRPYRPGAERRARAWVVKRDGHWLKCPHRDSAVQCVGYYQFPLTAVQE